MRTDEITTNQHQRPKNRQISMSRSHVAPTKSWICWWNLFCGLACCCRNYYRLRVQPGILPCNMAEQRPTAYDSKVEGNVIFTRFDAALNWVRRNSLWPMPMGLACCAIELMATAASRFDIARFGAEVMRFSPRQCDVMIVAGTVTYKMALAVKRIYEQMPEPKWVIAMGACASTGGMYRSYAVLQGIDQLLPVDVYISGCPPRPEALLAGLMKLQEKISTERSFRNQKPELAKKFEDALA